MTDTNIAVAIGSAIGIFCIGCLVSWQIGCSIGFGQNEFRFSQELKRHSEIIGKLDRDMNKIYNELGRVRSK